MGVRGLIVLFASVEPLDTLPSTHPWLFGRPSAFSAALHEMLLSFLPFMLVACLLTTPRPWPLIPFWAAVIDWLWEPRDRALSTGRRRVAA